MSIVSFHKRNCLAILVQSFFVCAFIGGYIAFLVTFLEQDRDQERSVTFPQADATSAEVVTLSASILSVSPADYTLKVSLDVAGVPNGWLDEKGQLNTTFTIGLGRTEVKVVNLNFNPPVVNIPLTKGSFDLYPFDDYESEVPVYVYVGTDPSTSMVDLVVQVRKAIFYGFSFDVDSRPLYQDIGLTEFKVKVERTGVFKVYPIFQIIAFLLIALVMAAFISAVIVWNQRKVEGPVFGAAISLIFALPAFRNTAPQSPPIGCTLDVCSFYWAMLVAILGFLGVTLRYAMQAPAAPPGNDLQQLMIQKAGRVTRKIRGIDDGDDDVPMQDMK